MKPEYLCSVYHSLKHQILLISSSLASMSGSSALSRSAWSRTPQQQKGGFRPEKPYTIRCKILTAALLQEASLNKTYSAVEVRFGGSTFKRNSDALDHAKAQS